jgi:molybdate transport system substrate-binding protein
VPTYESWIINEEENMSAWKAFLVSSILSVPVSAAAADLQVIAGGGIAAPLKEIAAEFEKASGHKLVIRYGTTPELIKMATGGPFDLGVVPVDVMRNDAARATFAAGAPAEVARVGLGVAVRSGAPKPDISTPDALKKTLLGARSIASIPESATGYLLAGIYERLGITQEMKLRIKPQPTPAQIAQSVASGETDLGVFLTNVLTAPGIDLVGPFPPELQMEVVYMTAVSAGTKDVEAAKAFIAYLRSPAAAALIKAKGMTPSKAL